MFGTSWNMENKSHLKWLTNLVLKRSSHAPVMKPKLAIFGRIHNRTRECENDNVKTIFEEPALKAGCVCLCNETISDFIKFIEVRPEQ